MAPFNPNKDVPSEFYSAKTFFTVSGAAASVWIFCIVIGSICPPDSISPLLYRVIAISLSELIALFMVFRAKRKKLENWFLAIFNGLLIFINASGWNVITTNNFFSDKNKAEQPKAAEQPNTSISSKNNYVLADFLFFKNQIYWWQDNSTFLENRQLKEEKKALTEKVAILDKKISSLNNGALNEGFPNTNLLNDSLRNEINKKESLIHDLKNEILLLKNSGANNKGDVKKAVVIDTLTSEERVQFSKSMRALQQNYETKLRICESEKKILQSKINIMNQGANKVGGVNNP